MFSPKVGPALVVTAALLLSAQLRAADPVPSLDLRGFHPAGDPNAGLYFEPAASPATADWNAAMWNSYSYRPVTLRNPADDEVVFEVVSHRITGDIVANIGLFERLAVGVDLPYLIYQTGDEPTADAQAVLGDYTQPAQALGDIKLLVKGTIIKPTNGEFGGFALAMHERLGLPTGNEASYLGEGAVQSETRLLVEYRYLALAVHGAVGIKLRAEDEQVGCFALAAEADCPTTFGDELPWGMSVAFRPQAIGLDDAGHWTWFVESFGYVPLSPESAFTNAAVSQAQLGGGARFTFKNDISVLAGIDAALVSGIGNPPVRATLALGWAPRKHDMDDDGVRDEQDLCPEDLKEDIDGFEDQDGCPDWDNDDDGVPDDSDRCDGEAEDEDGYQDDDGCADPDNDSDNILDIDDSCPDVPGIPSNDPKQRGCPDRDPDKDNVDVDKDKCPQEKEDPDQFEDDDGCPDPDNDGDGINDDEDRCRDVAGVTYENSPEDNGCPDGDGDGITDGKDACPLNAGVASEEPSRHGCPEPEEDDKDKRPRRGGR